MLVRIGGVIHKQRHSQSATYVVSARQIYSVALAHAWLSGPMVMLCCKLLALPSACAAAASSRFTNAASILLLDIRALNPPKTKSPQKDS
jgi:hypothetical protein